jgi:hypothetical protein
MFCIKNGIFAFWSGCPKKQARIARARLGFWRESPRAARKPLTPVRTLSLLARQVFLFDR